MKNEGLASCIGTPDGITAEQAENYAALKLEMLRELSLAEIDNAIDCISGYLRLLKLAVPPPAVEAELHRLSCEIAGIAGSFGHGALGEAAYSLCKLIDERSARGQWDRIAVDVHFDAMRLLRHPESISEAGQEHLLKGLRLVAGRPAGGAER
jgi:hypothetical protein